MEVRGTFMLDYYVGRLIVFLGVLLVVWGIKFKCRL
jgi:hypothetical protein